MNQYLANKENDLHYIVLNCIGTMEDKHLQLLEKRVYHEYRQIHSSYSERASDDIESLKRALFIQWYAITEPSCFTGIHGLDPTAEDKVINEINRLITSGGLDSELLWMLDYYFNWNFVFERFNEFESIQYFIQNRIKAERPEIDRSKMAQRGMMGRYWNSIPPQR